MLLLLVNVLSPFTTTLCCTVWVMMAPGETSHSMDGAGFPVAEQLNTSCLASLSCLMLDSRLMFTFDIPLWKIETRHFCVMFLPTVYCTFPSTTMKLYPTLYGEAHLLPLGPVGINIKNTNIAALIFPRDIPQNDGGRVERPFCQNDFSYIGFIHLLPKMCAERGQVLYLFIPGRPLPSHLPHTCREEGVSTISHYATGDRLKSQMPLFRKVTPVWGESVTQRMMIKIFTCGRWNNTVEVGLSVIFGCWTSMSTDLIGVGWKWSTAAKSARTNCKRDIRFMIFSQVWQT